MSATIDIGYTKPKPKLYIYQPESNELAKSLDISTNKTTPNSYIGWSIFNLICCNFVLGIFSLIFSFKTTSRLIDGRLDHAKHNSQMAFRFNVLSTVLGAIEFIICLLFLKSIEFEFGI